MSCLSLAGCSASSSVAHTPPEVRQPTSETSLDDSFDRVWQRLTTRLPTAGFAVTYADREVGIIEVTKSVADASDFVDCGSSQRTFGSGFGSIQVYQYDAAANSNYKLVRVDGTPLSASRATQLTVTANIFLEDAGLSTNFLVDAQYTLETAVTYQPIDGFGSVDPSVDPTTVTRDVVFHTRGQGTGDEEFSFCVSNGTLENEVIRLAS